MTRGASRLLAVFVVLAAVAVAIVVVWLVAFRPARKVVKEHTRTTVIVAPPMTPLPRDSGVKNNAKKKASSQPKLAASSSTQLSRPKVGSTPQAPKAPVVVKRPKATRPKTQRKPGPPAQTTTSPSPPPSRPPVTVTAPLPVQVCVRGLGGVNCP